MAPELFESVIDDLVEVGGRFDSLVMFWLGEPLLHPFFDRMRRHALRAAVRHGSFGRIEVHTNATHLGSTRVQALLNEADLPQVLHFSLDAIDRQTYREVKGVDLFEKVQANIENFIAQKTRRGARWPRPVFQYIVGSNNRSEAARFREHWEKICRQYGHPVRCAAGQVPPGEDAIIFFRQLDCPSPDQQEAENAVFRAEMVAQGLSLPEAAERGHHVRAENLAPCSGFWKSPVIGYRGDLTTCTLDSRFQNSLGNVGRQRFSELWWGDRIQEWRDQVSRGEYSGRELCSTCFIPHSINHTDLSLEDVARQASWARELRS
jgi:radical SAM protein with 4Fe4S-binding SPASM domain